MSDARLAELAAAVGLQLDWQDANGRPQRVDPEVQRGLLEALGYPAQSPQQIEQSLAALARLREDSANLGLLVGECGQPLEQALGPAGTPGEPGLRGRHADRPAPGRRRPPAGAGPQRLCAAVAGAAGMGGGDGAAEAARPWPASPRVARVAGVWPPRSMPCAAPATAAWATAPPSRTCCAAPRGMAPTRWRSARCTPWPRPTDMPTAPTRRPAGCSSMSCTPRRRPFSARRRWNRRSVAPAWPQRWPAWRAWS